MTVYNQWLNSRRTLSNFVGLSTDEKPTSSRGLVPNVSIFTSTDTVPATQHLWNGRQWTDMAIGIEFDPAEVTRLEGLPDRQFTDEEVVALKALVVP